MSDKPKLNPHTPAPKTQASAGSMVNMPSAQEVKNWNEVEKPKILKGIGDSWGKIKAAAKRMNGMILMNDRSTNG